MDRKLEIPRVKDILTKKVIAFKKDFTVFESIEIFNKYRISSAPVVNEQNEVVGYLSEGDCIRCMSNCLFYDERRGQAISNIMSEDVLAANGDWDIFELESFFIKNNLKSAPVVDSDKHLNGIVTRRDAMISLEKSIKDREDYKVNQKKPVELNMQERIKVIMINYNGGI